MSNLSFTSLHVNNQTINNAFALFKSSIDIAVPVKSYLGEIVNAALTKLISDNENFGQQINKNQKSGLTDDLKPLDKDRDDTEAEINRTVTFYAKGSDTTKKAFAQKLKLFLTPYWDAAALPQNTQTGVVSEMLGKYKTSPELVAAAKALGIDTLFTALETKNNAFDAVYKSRNDESSQAKISGSSLKPVAVASYNQFCTAMEQAVNLTPNEQNIALFYKLDEFRKKYHAMEGGKDTPAPVDTTTK
ncbi:MAG: DUF6261 family protein [Paludibacter sp.]|nr:DUF6261 family protein [Paludibacter sp.]